MTTSLLGHRLGHFGLELEEGSGFVVVTKEIARTLLENRRDPFGDWAGHKPLRCLTGKTSKPSVNPGRRIYSALPKFGNGVCVAVTRPKEEGRIAIVTNAGRTAVDASCIGAKGFAGRATVSKTVARTTGVIGVRQNRVVLAPGAWRQVLAAMWLPNRVLASAIRKATGAIVHRSPGRARHKP